MIMGCVFLLCTYGCKKEDNAVSQKFKFTISSDYILDNYQFWIIVSDDDKVLFSQKIENGKTYEMTNKTAALVDVHIFQYYESLPNQRLYVYTYKDVPFDEWTKSRQYSSTYLGGITITVSDLVNINNFTVSASRYSSSGTPTTPRTISAYANPENVLISYLPSDNSAMRYKYVQNVTPGQSLTYTMSDFQTASGLISYTLPPFGYYSLYTYGYNSNPNIAKYRLSSLSYINSAISTHNFYYPPAVFTNYNSSFYFEDDADATKAMHAIKYGALPTALPSVSFADITLTNENDIDLVSASITNSQNYQEFDFDYYVSTSPQYFEWYVMSKSSSTISNSLPDIPDEIKQKSSFFAKSNLNLYRAYLYKYIAGPAASYNDYISMSIKPSIAFNEVVTEYKVYYKYPLSKKKKGEIEREPRLIDRDYSFNR
jgi:hypothetical protein